MGARGSFHGSISELIVFSGPLSVDDTAGIETVLSDHAQGGDQALPQVGSAKLLAHFRATAASVELGEDGFVNSWTASNDPALKALALGRPRRILCYREASEDAHASVLWRNESSASRWLERALPDSLGADVLTVFCLGTNEPWNRHVIQWFYSIGTLAPPLGRVERSSKRVDVANEYSPDGSLLLTGDALNPAPAVLRNATTGEVIRILGDDYLGVAFHPSGNRFACGSDRGTIDVFETKSGQLLAQITGHTSRVYSLATHQTACASLPAAMTMSSASGTHSRSTQFSSYSAINSTLKHSLSAPTAPSSRPPRGITAYASGTQSSQAYATGRG